MMEIVVTTFIVSFVVSFLAFAVAWIILEREE